MYHFCCVCSVYVYRDVITTYAREMKADTYDRGVHGNFRCPSLIEIILCVLSSIHTYTCAFVNICVQHVRRNSRFLTSYLYSMHVTIYYLQLKVYFPNTVLLIQVVQRWLL